MSLTPEQVRNNIEYRAAVKILKQKYPFIKKVSFDEDKINEYESLLFLNAYVNPYELAEYFDGELEDFVIFRMKKKEDFITGFPSVFLKDKTYEDLRDFEEELDDTLKSLHNSPALPREEKLSGSKRFAVNNYITDNNTKIRDEE